MLAMMQLLLQMYLYGEVILDGSIGRDEDEAIICVIYAMAWEEC